MAKRKERDIIAIIGKTNAGKSSLLNLLSGQKNYALVDETPGTTADTVKTIMEIHDLGPFKVLDTAGVDEYSKLGDKKRKKTYEAIEEADLNLVVIDSRQKNREIEKKLIRKIKREKKQILVVINLFEKEKIDEREFLQREKEFDLPVIALNIQNTNEYRKLIDFIKKNYRKESRNIDLLPSVKSQGFVLLIIPMDEETPTLRLLRPQDMALERILRKFALPVMFRLDLSKARSDDSSLVASEKKRYTDLLKMLKNSPEGLQLIITDSQAFDIVPQWTPKKIALTSFSIMMAHYMSQGNLDLLLDGVKKIEKLKTESCVLVAESCNHDRKCNDIGTVQIPKILTKKIGQKLNFDFNFGRPFPEDLKKYDLIIHCGACMIDRQSFTRKILKAQEANVPITNYGIFLAYMQNKIILERVTQVFFGFCFNKM